MTTDDEIITLEPGDSDVVADFDTLREYANQFDEHFENDELFVRMLLHGGYRELLELADDYSDDDGDDDVIRGYQ